MTTTRNKPPLFPHQPSRASDSSGDRREYDYSTKYPPDNPGEEHKENARVWNVFLDEAESHDNDMLQGFREIIDGVLIFASLFSAVVTTFVAQTSQALGTDNSQIMVSLLVETNQLLRATGNSTTINAIPNASLLPGHTAKDVWINALFFISLGLSLITALLTVLVKQWLHAYSSFINGDAKTRAFIIEFRSKGLRTWRLRQIVEALPLILHGSVLIFFLGLVLYISQLSTVICGILAFIAALAFIFYLGTSFLPVFFIGCPYRIPFLFDVGQSILASLYAIGVAVLSLVMLAQNFISRELFFTCKQKMLWLKSKTRRQSLNSLEHETILARMDPTNTGPTFDVLNRLVETSSERSTTHIVLVALFSMLSAMEESETHDRYMPAWLSRSKFQHDLVWYAFKYTLYKYLETESTSGPVPEGTGSWQKGVDFLNERIDHEERGAVLLGAYQLADGQGNEQACGRILDWFGTPALEDASNSSIVINTMKSCTGTGIQQILNRTTAILCMTPDEMDPLLHQLVAYPHLGAVKAVLEIDQSNEVVNLISRRGQTPLDIALQGTIFEVVNCLMDHGARASHSNHESAFFAGIGRSDWRLVKLLWARRSDVTDTTPDSWCRKSAVEIAKSISLSWMEETKRCELIEILQECDELHVEQEHLLEALYEEVVTVEEQFSPNTPQAEETNDDGQTVHSHLDIPRREYDDI